MQELKKYKSFKELKTDHKGEPDKVNNDNVLKGLIILEDFCIELRKVSNNSAKMSLSVQK